MQLETVIALAATMIVLAATPGPGVLLVVSRTLALNFRHGVYTSAGIVAGDFVYIAVVVASMSFIAATLEPLFLFIQYASAAYLMWLGVQAWRNADKPLALDTEGPKSQHSFWIGLVVTLGNPKAILFYLGFLPAFIDLTQVNAMDVLILYILAAVIVGGVMVCYAFAVSKSKNLLADARFEAIIQRAAGSIFIVTGLWILLRR
ncbi:LysE family translocator [Teredinibacter turnerae]|uniref:LysE family translocator n=1 Tax=Teredinibacter turnerae TaxID=2426 RepID=UPI00037EDD95|nr:LysE family translocator [Teredinibacter turnerae]